MKIIPYVLFFLLTACSHAPKESVQLSYLVGERIKDIQISHEAIVGDYFQLMRQQVSDYFDNHFTPTLLKNMVRLGREELENTDPLSAEDKQRLIEELVKKRIDGSRHNDVLKAVSNALGDAERGQIYVEFVEAAFAEIEKERQPIIQSLLTKEQSVLKEIRGAYAELHQMHSVVTAHLQSINNVTLEQDALLERLGLLKKRDKAIEQAMGLNEKIIALLAKSGNVEQTITAIKQLIDE